MDLLRKIFTRIRASHYRGYLTTAVLLLLTPAAQSQIQFQDVSSTTGMTGFTESWGASWGDLNGDNWPDLFMQGHRHYPRAYRNTGEGTFEDIAYQMDPGVWIAKPAFQDKHGASHADFDNDGDEDLLIGQSNTGPAELLVNENGVFTNRAAEAGIDSDNTNRLGIWFDYTGDGFLDLAQLHLDGSYLRRQNPANGLDFDLDTGAGFSCNGDNNYGQLVDLNNDGKLEFICAEEGVYPERVYDVSTYPFQDLTSTIPNAALVNETLVADFNGDLRNDIVMVRGSLRPSGAVLASSRNIEAWLRRSHNSAAEKGFTFSSPGQITVVIDDITQKKYQPPYVLSLNPQGPSSGCGGGSFIGVICVSYDSGNSRWKVLLYNDYTLQAYVSITTVEPVTNLADLNLDVPEMPITPMYLQSKASGGMSFFYGTGFNEPMSCGGGAAGDFDNDMDVDLYLVCRRGAGNLENRLYENQGNATFVRVPDAGGAAGPVGAGREFGIGDTAAVADYDVDGYLDLFVANGLLYFPVGQGGPDKLYHNLGNGNNWLEIDLAGTTSNHDGVGAKVYVTAGGKTQLREQNGGYHRWSQDHQRLHFGLAGNLTAEVRIQWPSGTVDTFNGIVANALYDATEGGTFAPAVLGPPVHTHLMAGDECGEPPYNLDYGPVLLLWRDCPAGNWHLRARGGRESKQKKVTTGTLVADMAYSAVSTQGFAGSDKLDTSNPAELKFSFGVWLTNNKVLNFSTTGQTRSCMDLTRQDIRTIIVGSSRKRVQAPLDLVTFGACTTPPPPPECGEPTYNKATEVGVFVWRNCTAPGPGQQWHVRVTGGGGPVFNYQGAATSDMALSATGYSIEANDVFDTVPNDATVDFKLRAGGAGVDGFQLAVPAGAQSCLNLTALPAGTQIQLGVGRQPKGTSLNLVSLGACN